ncbi:hypothetical protein GDO86_009025 [Hymenochirus boettgeri]|uniref:Ankyrin repeat domain 63 n=1 Tax=Hymenochirus boettgeri TaxID=247094 RepID=A0A8T2JJF6_9PIPI|nr:hypothetical protein GDO86_009025 [Hymenochirus boettgeri]
MLNVSGDPIDVSVGNESADDLQMVRFVVDSIGAKKVIGRFGEMDRTPLICCSLLPDPRDRLRYMRLLLEIGAAVNDRDRSGRSALSYSAERGHVEEVKLLVGGGADPELPDRGGNTALMYAALAGQSRVLDFLVRAFRRLGLEIGRVNRVGNSALDVARSLGHRNCELALIGSRGPTLERSRSLAPRGPIQSMGSIEEEEAWKGRGTEGFSRLLSPRPRSWSLQYWGGEQRAGGQLLPPLPSNTAHRLGKQEPPLLGPLGILLIPAKNTLGCLDRKPGDTGVKTFNDAYYRKRSSLPTALLCPTPPDRVATASNPFAVLGNRLLRSFTFPEFKKQQVSESVGEPPVTGGDGKVTGEPEKATAASEMFPKVKKHPRIVHKPSVDSISSVKCEFDFQPNT